MKKILLLIGLLVITGCSNDTDDTPFVPTTIEFFEIGKDMLSGSEGIEESNLVITNSSDWQNLMTQMDTVNDETDDFTETNIDFEQYLIIAVFTEVKPFQWKVDITNITEKEDRIVVEYKEAIVATVSVITQPFHIVKIPITDKPFEFELLEE